MTPPQTYDRPTHAQANSQLDGLADRMERLIVEPHTSAVKCEVLVETLMVIARNMPTEPKRQIARILAAYDQV